MKREELELTRHDVTPGQFLSYVRAMIKNHGLTAISAGDIDMKYWAAGSDRNFDITGHDKEKDPCAAERSISKPYQMQTYIKNWDGTVYNLILEFDFWDDKKGFGYFYFLNTWQEETEKQEETDTETTTKKKENETMTTANNTTTAAEQTFPRLMTEITANYNRLTADTFHYIWFGWFPSWANEHHNDPDRGIKQYSTARRWEQYKAGEITREKAIKLAEHRAANEIEKNRAEKIASLEAAANAPRISSASVSVEWTKSRTWGANPTAELLNIGYGRTIGHASGCGYDKESAAIAEAMNASPAALRVLYELGEAALERGESPRSVSACTGYNWGKCIGYGAGYSVLPYWEGGVGSSCFWDILKKAGYTVRHAGSGKRFDCYTFYATLQSV